MGIVALLLFLVDFVLNLIYPKYNTPTKCLLMPLLAAFYLFQSQTADPLMIAALACGWVGDCLLIREDSNKFFQTGLVAFLAGHVVYALIFYRSTNHWQDVPAWFFGIAAIYLLLIGLFYIYLRKGLAHFRIPFLVYCIGICTMSYFALSRVFNLSAIEFALPFIGSLLFIASDMILACNHFARPVKHVRLLVMITYVAAQFMIVLSYVL